MLWIRNQLPSTAPDTADELPALRKQVSDLEAEITNEKALSKKHQTDVIQRRYKNDELVAMMALLRTEMEAISARHNIILSSDVAKQASERLHRAEATAKAPVTLKATTRSSSGSSDTGAGSADIPPVERSKEDDENDGDDEGGGAEEYEDDNEEAVAVAASADGVRPKRGLDVEAPEGSTRPKRRKV
jgi:hypothetical protein